MDESDPATPTCGDPQPPGTGQTRSLSPAQLQVLGRHKVRLRIIDELTVSGPATATMLAVRVGGNSGTLSYHLRQLAAAGIIDEASELRRGKERWWRLPRGGLNFFTPDRSDEPVDNSVFAGMFIHEQDEADAARMHSFVSQLTRADDPRTAAWRGTVIAHRNTLLLTPAELRDLGEQLLEFMTPWFEASAHHAQNPDDGAETVVFAARAFPVFAQPVGAGGGGGSGGHHTSRERK